MWRRGRRTRCFDGMCQVPRYRETLMEALGVSPWDIGNEARILYRMTKPAVTPLSSFNMCLNGW